MANVALSTVNTTLLPPIITEPIFQKTANTSAVQQLARKVPLSVNAQTAIPVMLDVPTADWVVEGGSKPTGSAGVGVKIMQGKKLALLVPVSQELVSTNSAGLYDQLLQDLPTAMGRAFDAAAIRGKSLKTGAPGPFTSYLSQTPNQQVIGASAANAGGVYADLVKGEQQVVNAGVGGYEFSGFAADPRLKPELKLSVDTIGRPIMIGQDAGAVNGGANFSNLIDYPAYFSAGVSGKYYRSGDAVQIITLTGTPTGGTFVITVGGQASGPLAFNASAATVQTALRALVGGYQGVTSVDPFGVTVTGSAGSPYTLTFTGAAGPVYVDQTGLTGGTAATSQATITQTPVADSGLRAIGGDWSQCAWGQGMDITIKVSTEANYFDGTAWHSAFQENLVLLLVESYYGFVVNDTAAFVAYTHAPGS